jgi:hypothetical protein
MAGAIAHGELTARDTGRIRFEVAGPKHDAAIRHLLRESAMDGAIVLTREREPNYFAGANIAGAEDETVVALESNNVIAMAGCSIRRRYVNGVPRRVGYLAELRLARSAQGRFDVLRRGFQFYASRHQSDPADIYFTSIAADNLRSIRFLEHGLPGMPRYEFLTEFVTLLIACRVKGAVPERSHGSADAFAIAQCLNAHGARYQFAAHLTGEEIGSLRRWGLSPGHFQTISDGRQMVACAALWDQRGFKQTVVREYSARLRRSRPFLNLLARVSRDVLLPPRDSVLPNAFLSPVAMPDREPSMLLEMIAHGLRAAQERGLEMVTLGFDVNDPRLGVVRRRFRCREYRTRLYRVHWPDLETDVGELDGRIFAPEVSLL